MCIDELKAERTSLTAGTAQAKMERDTLVARTPDLDHASESCHRGRMVVVRVVRCLTGRPTAGKDKANIADSRTHGTLNKMSKLQALFKIKEPNC